MNIYFVNYVYSNKTIVATYLSSTSMLHCLPMYWLRNFSCFSFSSLSSPLISSTWWYNFCKAIVKLNDRAVQNLFHVTILRNALHQVARKHAHAHSRFTKTYSTSIIRFQIRNKSTCKSRFVNQGACDVTVNLNFHLINYDVNSQYVKLNSIYLKEIHVQ